MGGLGIGIIPSHITGLQSWSWQRSQKDSRFQPPAAPEEQPQLPVLPQCQERGRKKQILGQNQTLKPLQYAQKHRNASQRIPLDFLQEVLALNRSFVRNSFSQEMPKPLSVVPAFSGDSWDKSELFLLRIHWRSPSTIL